MVVRASKHVLRRLMDSQPHLRAAPASALAAFLNHLLGNGSASTASSSSSSSSSSGSNNSKKKKKKSNNSSDSSSATAAAAAGSSTSLGAASGATGAGGKGGDSSASSVASSSDPLDEEHLWALCGSVVAPEPPLPEGLQSSQALWALIAAEVRRQ